MSAPRFLFLSRPAATRRAGGAGTAPEFLWRLVAGNNHVLGRCPHPFEALAECQDAVTVLVASAAQIVTSTGRDSRPGAWTWQLGLPGGEPLAISARSYERQRECRCSLDNFTAALPVAGVVSKVAVRPRPRATARWEASVPVPREVQPRDPLRR